MARAYYSTMVDKPADEVWAAIRDFNALPAWFSEAVSESKIEEGKAGDQVGAVRSFTLRDGTHLRERLLSHSDVTRCYSYNFEKTPFDVDNYHATLRVTKVVDGDRAFVEWWTTFDCDRDKIAYWQDFFANQIFQAGLTSLKAYLGV
ncbi:MAG: MxaD family protein [Thermoleophilia bacterium]